LDFATNARPPETTRVLQGWADRRYFVGVRFGTVGALKADTRVEITTFREEIYAEEHRKPAVTYGKDVHTDLSRRDFTINAMAIRVPDGTLIDPFGGVQALGARSLDTPLDPEIAFSDDPLRMVRAARFVAQLDVVPAERVLEAIRRMRERLAIVAVERIQTELDKLLVAPHAAEGLAVLVDSGLADEFLPELSALRLEQDPVHHHKDVLRHTYAVVERCEPDLVLRLAGLLHDIGKPKTRQIGADGVSFHHHEVVGARMARERLTALRYPNATVDDVCTLIELHLRFHGYGEGWTDAAVRRYVRDAGPLLDRLNQLTRADVTTRNAERATRFAALQDDLEERIAALAEEENLEAMRPPLDGRQVMERLGIGPGPVVGEALAYLMEVRMERGPVPEDEAHELLEAWAKERGITG
jgi:poly(A) polymerase